MEKKLTEKQKAALKKGREALKKKQAAAKKAVRKELSKTKKSIKKTTSKIMTTAKTKAAKNASKKMDSLKKRLHKKGLAGKDKYCLTFNVGGQTFGKYYYSSKKEAISDVSSVVYGNCPEGSTMLITILEVASGKIIAKYVKWPDRKSAIKVTEY